MAVLLSRSITGHLTITTCSSQDDYVEGLPQLALNVVDGFQIVTFDKSNFEVECYFFKGDGIDNDNKEFIYTHTPYYPNEKTVTPKFDKRNSFFTRYSLTMEGNEYVELPMELSEAQQFVTDNGFDALWDLCIRTNEIDINYESVYVEEVQEHEQLPTEVTPISQRDVELFQALREATYGFSEHKYF